MESPTNGPLYAAIGEALLQQLGEPDPLVWAYFEVGDGWLDESAFVDHGAYLEAIEIDDRVSDAIFAAWESEPPGRRWQGMEYAIGNGRFNTRLTYPDALDPNQFTSDRADALIATRFGNKEIRYPAL